MANNARQLLSVASAALACTVESARTLAPALTVLAPATTRE